MFYFSLDLFDLHENTILVKLTRNKLFKVDNIYLLSRWDPSGGDSTLNVYIEEIDENKAKEQLTRFINLLNFLYDIDITIASSLHLYEAGVLPAFEIINAGTTTNNNIKKINNVVQKIKNLNPTDYKIIDQSLRYYSRSLKLMELELHEDSFLTAFKPIELIANYIYKNNYQQEFNEYIGKLVPQLLKELFDEEYRDENKDKEINMTTIATLENVQTQRRKISKTLGFLNLNSLKDEIGQVVRLRNKIGAHGNSGKLILGIDESLNCQKICKHIVTTYLFGNLTQLTKLDCERKI
ncbi:hypothetical protein ACIQWQ_07860 [Peribacillus frigoritolerans]